MRHLFSQKPFALLAEESADEGEHTLKRTLGPWSLMSLGIGAIIGAGIFVLTGEAAYRNAGPAVVLSFVAAGLACAFAGLCYAEFASLIPVAGSAYTYGYATLGELFAWIIGWDLVLEYALAASTVSVGWSGYFGSLLSHFGIAIPPSISTSTYVLNAQGDFEYTGAENLTAVAILFFASTILAIGIRESAAVNTLIVVLKVSIVVLFIGVGVWYVNPQNWWPFLPENTGEFGHYGWSGVFRGASLVFFAYIGFDAVSTAAQESRNPKRADRHPWVAGRLHGSLHLGGGRFDRTGELHRTRRPTSDLGGHSSNAIPVAWLAGGLGSGPGPGFCNSSDAVWTVSRFLRDVEGRRASRNFLQDSSQVPDAVCSHLAHRRRGRNPRCRVSDRRVGPHGEHRNVARIRNCFRQRHHFASAAAGTSSALQGAGISLGPRAWRVNLRGPHVLPAPRDLGAARHLDGVRSVDLRVLRQKTQ